MTSKEKTIDIALLLGTAFAILTALFAKFAGECDALHESTFRLHIIANSNSEEDQKIKYALRDYILTDLGGIFTDCTGSAEAKAAAVRNSAAIAEKVNAFLTSRGCTYTAEVTAAPSEFPTRVYGDYTLPSGTYESLRVVLGEGKGKNWWCVLYPSVCIKAASADKPVFPTRTLYEQNKRSNRATADSLRSDRGTVEFRFALYDLLLSLLQ